MKYFKGIIILNVIILNSYTHGAGEPTLLMLKSRDQQVSFLHRPHTQLFARFGGIALHEKEKRHASFSSP